MNSTAAAIFAFCGLVGGGIGLAWQEPPPDSRKKVLSHLGIATASGVMFGPVMMDLFRIFVACFTSTPLAAGVHEYAAGTVCGFCGWHFFAGLHRMRNKLKDRSTDEIAVDLWRKRFGLPESDQNAAPKSEQGSGGKPASGEGPLRPPVSGQ